MVRSLGLLYTSPQQDCVTVVTLNICSQNLITLAFLIY